jgi:lysophospholipase L1-like esterase
MPEIIAVIKAAAARNPNLHLISFSEYVKTHRHTMDEVCLPNDVHLNAVGNALWAAMIHEALEKLAT